MLAGQVVGRTQPVAAAPDDQSVILGPGFGAAPLRRPAALAGEAAQQELEAGEGLHRKALQLGPSAPARASCSARSRATSTRASVGLNECDIARLARAPRLPHVPSLPQVFGAAVPLMAVRGFTCCTNSAT